MRPTPFGLSVVSDEIGTDLERVLVVARELGCAAIELNGVGGRNLTDWEDEEATAIERQVARAGLPVIAIGTPCFKACQLDEVPAGRVDEDETVRAHLACLEKGCAWASRLGAPWVRLFSFRRTGMVGLGNPSPRLVGGGPLPPHVLAKIVEGLRLAAEVALRWRVTLVVENVRSCWGNSGTNTARILSAVDSQAVRGLWDPANAYVSGEEDGQAGYAAMAPWIAHVHAKDARVVDPASGLTAWEAMGQGEVEWMAQFRALQANGYQGMVSLETHWRPPQASPEDATRASMKGLQRLLALISAEG